MFNGAWPENCRGRTGLDPYFDLVGYTLDVKPVPPEWREAGKTRVMTEAFRTATNGVPENVFYPPLAINIVLFAVTTSYPSSVSSSE